MYRKSFPKCEIQGDRSPSKKKQIMGSISALPNKCLSCEFLFEGECLRAEELAEDYLRLDYGSCGIEGNTEPKVIKVSKTGIEIFVPNKCIDCEFLIYNSTLRYVCSKDQEIWGDGFRELDWGDWQPKFPNVGLRKFGRDDLDLGNVAITNKVIQHILDGHKTKALKVYKDLNNISTIKEAREDIEQIEIKLKKAQNKV